MTPFPTLPTTSPIWNYVLELTQKFESRIAENSQLLEEAGEYDWYNRLYTSDRFRRAHVEVVDKTQTAKILVLHCTIFPHYNDPSPIWGCDLVCGPSKITGAFHDMSNGGDPDHKLMQYFADRTRDLKWKRPRDLPEWATEIFSPSIVAAGNVNDPAELDVIGNLALETLEHFLANVGQTRTDDDYYELHRRYNSNNRLNPHVKRSMISMGVPEEVITKFIEEVLFPTAR